jgi:hypothetical protein
LLLSQKNYSKNNQKDPQKHLIVMVGSKTTCPKWHLGQVKQGPFGVPFDEFSHSKKPCFLVVFEVNKYQFENFLKIKKNRFFSKIISH